ncbi:MAG: DUF5615 family PIN-like protein [Ignavibacteriae bacterium]|nr:DUF5615 family PIN-like protein [Ignavibacteriota bacterium]
MAPLYSNENFPFPSVEELRRLGHDVTTTQESGQAGKAIPDEGVLLFAIKENRVLVTLNRKHFIGLHTTQPNHCGIIVCTFDSDFSSLAKRIHDSVISSIPLDGKLIRVNRPNE